MVKYHGQCVAHATVVAKNRASHCNCPCTPCACSRSPPRASAAGVVPAGSISHSRGIFACCPPRAAWAAAGASSPAAASLAALRHSDDRALVQRHRPAVCTAGTVEAAERAQHAVRFVSWNQCGSQAANLGTEHATAYGARRPRGTTPRAGPRSCSRPR